MQTASSRIWTRVAVSISYKSFTVGRYYVHTSYIKSTLVLVSLFNDIRTGLVRFRWLVR